jgi:uncharacterized protein YdhG (YjbR/CyaY superfamily)
MKLAMQTNFKNVDEYIAAYPSDIKIRLQKIRDTIKKISPSAQEIISYQMPAFRLRKILVYYAAHTNHIGLYFSSRTVYDAFKQELSSYEVTKGTIRFPNGRPLPMGLISKIIKHRVQENLAGVEKGNRY